MLHTNLIGTDCQLICPKETLIIGPYGARLSCQSVAQCNRRLRYHGAAAVTDGTLKTRRNSRSLSGSIRTAQQQSGRDCRLDNSTTHGKQTAMPNHRPPIFKASQEKPTDCLDRMQGRPLRGAGEGEPLPVRVWGQLSRISRDGERQGGRTRSIKKQQEETALRRKKGFLRAGSEDVLRNNIKQVRFGDEARKRSAEQPQPLFETPASARCRV